MDVTHTPKKIKINEKGGDANEKQEIGGVGEGRDGKKSKDSKGTKKKW